MWEKKERAFLEVGFFPSAFFFFREWHSRGSVDSASGFRVVSSSPVPCESAQSVKETPLVEGKPMAARENKKLLFDSTSSALYLYQPFGLTFSIVVGLQHLKKKEEFFKKVDFSLLSSGESVRLQWGRNDSIILEQLS